MKQIPTIWKNQETKSAARFNQFPERCARELTPMCSAGTVSALVRMVTFSATAIAMVSFILFSKGYSHGDCLHSRFALPGRL
jgi:hypothetical protein